MTSFYYSYHHMNYNNQSFSRFYTIIKIYLVSKLIKKIIKYWKNTFFMYHISLHFSTIFGRIEIFCFENFTIENVL